MSGNMSLSVNEQSQVPPGFRFHPTEEELLQYYLRKKVANEQIDLDVIRDVDLNKLEPWDIQDKCKIGSTPQNDWYFFSHKDKKYPTGTRTNRATTAGFWKATGRDKVIQSNCNKIGMRKTLVFYKGRAPHGQKSDWIMHEYRLLDDNVTHDINVSAIGESGSEEGWVVCRVFKKKNYHKSLDGSHQLSSTLTETRLLNNAYNNKHSTNDEVLDQILAYMGRSCKQENETITKNIQFPTSSFIDDYQTTSRFLHLPGLECPTTYNNDQECLLKAYEQQSSFDDSRINVIITEPHDNPNPIINNNNYSNNLVSVDDYTKSGPSNNHITTNWVALDRLVASQLNGQVEDLKNKTLANCFDNNADQYDDESFSFSFIDHHNQHNEVQVMNPCSNKSNQESHVCNTSELEFWNFARSSSSY
ncbi:hypothetical protein Leryth_023139 [Lithospermum erythrorhizon]|nr:hypothetical protein Leryth_023139 [Lithospermum erythrorhizon]